MFKQFRAGGAAFALSWLAACGGGSDDEAGTHPTVVGLTLTIISPSSVFLETTPGGQVADVTLQGAMSGDLNKLGGRTLYLYAEVPDKQFFTDTPRMAVQANGSGALTLVGRPGHGKAAGEYKNTITVRACLDAECKQELQTTNARIPYTITVKPA